MAKEYSDVCFTCGESKEGIKYSQKIGDPIYCVTGSYGEGGFEADQEYDRHRFVRTYKQRLAEEADEKAYLEQMTGWPEYMANSTPTI
jgi:hypothetical protein